MKANGTACALAILVAACDSSPTGPGYGFLPGPLFTVYPTPDGAVDGIGCALHQAYAFSDHFLSPLDDSNRVKFYAEGLGERPQCGDLPFAAQSAQAGDTVAVSYILDTGGQWEYWARRMRRTLTPYQFVQDSMVLDSIPKYTGVGDPNAFRVAQRFSAATLVDFDLTAFGFVHAATQAALSSGDPIALFDTATVDAVAHLWGSLPPPTGLGATVVNGNQPRLTWTNHHRERSVDSTEIFRNNNGGAGWQYRARVSGTATQWTDTALAAGAYSYFIRHVTARTFPTFVEDTVARPNSPTTNDTTLSINALPAPSNLSCSATSSTSIHCSWTNGTAADSVVVHRQDGPTWPEIKTLPPGTTQYTDTGRHASVTYSHQVRHRDGSLTSALSNTASATTPLPEAPTALACVGSWGTWVTCAWTNTVPADSTQVFRGGVLRTRLGPSVASWTDDPVTHDSTYVYQVRHVDLTVAGALGPPDTTIANQPGPDNLSCGRTGATTATCVWVNTDPGNDTIEVFRKSNKPWGSTPHAVLVGTAIQFDDTGLASGAAYTYRLRYKLSGQSVYSLWSNEDGVGTTWPEPYGPIGGP